MASGKRRSEEYQQVIGYVRKPLAVKFKTYCRAKEVEISEVLEELIQKWVEEQGDLFDNNKNNQ